MSERQELLRAAKILGNLACLTATDGNLSTRVDKDQILITRTAIEKRTLTENGLLLVDLANDSPEGVSSEWPMHQIIYRSRPEINSILHVHSPALTAFAAARKLPDTALLTEAEMAIGEIALVPFASPGSVRMGTNLITASSTASVYLLSNHGALSVGSSVTDALHRLERAELLAGVQLSTESIGGAHPLNEQEIQSLNS